jgi:amidohydrolase
MSDKKLKKAASSSIDENTEELRTIGEKIWSSPELCYKEHKAHDLLTDFLEKKGFSVERSYTGMETAFRATFGSGRPNVCVICEYDALPEIGHACGHNLIAEAGVAAGLGLKAALESSNAPKGRLTVMGTPAEEGGGGKVKLINNGAFDDIDIAMMVHPTPHSGVRVILNCISSLQITYTGKAAHAAAFPWEGVNALDAAVMAYNSVSVLRQQMKPTWRVHGVITNGGAKPNIIPEKAVLEFNIRAPSISEHELLSKKVNSCFEAAAKATSCSMEIIELMPTYLEVLNNPTLAEKFGENWGALGASFDDVYNLGASTDMGNVSYKVPSIHPCYQVGSGSEANHTREFTTVTNTPEAHAETLVIGKAMAHTCIDVLTTDGLLEEIKKTFKDQTEN